jgi:hypothetical protein
MYALHVCVHADHAAAVFGALTAAGSTAGMPCSASLPVLNMVIEKKTLCDHATCCSAFTKAQTDYESK